MRGRLFGGGRSGDGPPLLRLLHERRTGDLLVATVLALALVTSAPDTARIGRAFQVALPVMALGCAAARGEVPAILLRYIALEAGIRAPKALLGDHPLNRRPDGSLRGFPSGHMARASFGAVHLVQHCAQLHPVTRGAALLAAGFVGGSRLEADRHTLWQVTGAAIWGWAVAVAPLHLARRRGRDRRARRVD